MENSSFNCIYCSSEHVDYPFNNLFSSSQSGWISRTNPKYPITAVVNLKGDFILNGLQIVSHESMITTQINIYISNNPNLNGIDINNDNFFEYKNQFNWKNVGYFCFSSNERSNWVAREYKKVFIQEIQASYIMFSISECYKRVPGNAYKQVSIISLKLNGVHIYRPHFGLNLLDMFNDLVEAKKTAIQNENFALADIINIQIENTKRNQDILNNLFQRKQIALENEEFLTVDSIIEQIFSILNQKIQPPQIMRKVVVDQQQQNRNQVRQNSTTQNDNQNAKLQKVSTPPLKPNNQKEEEIQQIKKNEKSASNNTKKENPNPKKTEKKKKNQEEEEEEDKNEEDKENEEEDKSDTETNNGGEEDKNDEEDEEEDEKKKSSKSNKNQKSKKSSFKKSKDDDEEEEEEENNSDDDDDKSKKSTKNDENKKNENKKNENKNDENKNDNKKNEKSKNDKKSSSTKPSKKEEESDDDDNEEEDKNKIKKSIKNQKITQKQEPLKSSQPPSSPNGEETNKNAVDPLTDEAIRESERLIELFGEEVVAMVYSDNWEVKSNGLVSLCDKIKQLNDKNSQSDAVASLFPVLHKMFSSNLKAIYVQAVEQTISLIDELNENETFSEKNKFLRKMIYQFLNLALAKLSNTNHRINEASLKFVKWVSKIDKTLMVEIAQFTLKPSSQKQNSPLLDKNKLDLLNTLITENESVLTSKLNIKDVMQFFLKCLESPNEDVRKNAILLFKKCYSFYGQKVTKYIEDLPKTNKKVLMAAIESNE